MKPATGFRSILGMTMVTLLVTSSPVFAEDDLTPLTEGKPTHSWRIIKHASTGAVEMIARDIAGSLSTMCQDDVCGVFVEPVAGCVPGASYPVLINSSKRVGVVPSQCATIPSSDPSGVRHIVMFKEQKAMIQALMEELDLSIAFPTQAGAMDVINVPMRGVRDMLATVMPELPESPASKPDASSPRKADEHTRTDSGKPGSAVHRANPGDAIVQL